MAKATAPPIIDWHLRYGFGSPRSTAGIRAVYVHTTENDPSTDAENVANYQLRKQNGSYHYIVDRTKLLFCNTDDWRTYSTANLSNNNGLHISFVGWAADPKRNTKMLRADWLAEEKNYRTLSRGAWQIARWCKKYNIPPTYIFHPALVDGAKGITTHNESRLAFGVTTHWDPGPDFPMDVLITLVKQFLNATPAPTPTQEELPAMSNPWEEEITASDGTKHTAGELLSYTDGRVFRIYTEDLPRLENKLDNLIEKLDRAAGDN